MSVSDIPFFDQSEPISERDIWLTAGELIHRVGDVAAIEASKIAEECMTEGDLAGQAIWLRVVRSITALTDPMTASTPN